MVERIKELECPERFWGWLFRTALGVVQHYYRDRAREQAIALSATSRRGCGSTWPRTTRTA